MNGFRSHRSIGDRIQCALELASEGGRTPTGLALGKEDFPAFETWMAITGPASDGELRFQGLRVRHLTDVFLSRLDLTAKLGAPNSILL